MKTWYITYAKGDKYTALLPAHEAVAKADGFSEFIGYTFADLQKTCEYRTRKDIYDAEKGAGYWTWKSYYILRTMEEAHFGDVVFYVDAGDRVMQGMRNFMMAAIENKHGRMLARHCLFYNREWVKEDLFRWLSMTDKRFRDAPQIEAGIQAWLKTDANMAFLGEWRSLSKIKKFVDGSVENPNGPDFKDFRYDQSVYSMLVARSGFPTIDITEFYPYVKFNNLSGELP